MALASGTVTNPDGIKSLLFRAVLHLNPERIFMHSMKKIKSWTKANHFRRFSLQYKTFPVFQDKGTPRSLEHCCYSGRIVSVYFILSKLIPHVHWMNSLCTFWFSKTAKKLVWISLHKSSLIPLSSDGSAFLLRLNRWKQSCIVTQQSITLRHLSAQHLSTFFWTDYWMLIYAQRHSFLPQFAKDTSRNFERAIWVLLFRAAMSYLPLTSVTTFLKVSPLTVQCLSNITCKIGID